MIWIEGKPRSQVRTPFSQTLSRYAEDQIDADTTDMPPDPLHGMRHVRREMVAAENLQYMRLKGLDTKANAGDAMFRQNGDLVVCQACRDWPQW